MNKQAQHSALPWKFKSTGQFDIVVDADGLLVGDFTFKHDADFIVNAANSYAHLQAINAQLLEALYLALPFVEDHSGNTAYKSGVVKKACKQIEAAIAAAESK